MPAIADTVDLRAVIRLLPGPESSPLGGATSAEEHVRRWQDEDWSLLLLHLPFDGHGFLGEYEQTWDVVIEGLERWCDAFHGRPEEFKDAYRLTFGRIGLLLVTLVALRDSYARRYQRDGIPDHESTHTCDRLCEQMLREPPVRDAIRRLYRPDVPAPGTENGDTTVAAEWARIDFDSLRFHRHGTTSFILVGRSTPVHGRRRQLALKCILYPYLRVPAIVRATAGYCAAYGARDEEVRHLAHVWASSPRWILMDFVPGETLAEFLQRQPVSDKIRLGLLEELGRELFTALAALEHTGLRHGDLSPSNIIVSEAETSGAGGTGPSVRRSFVLIDLGVNHLYSHAVPGSDAPDAAYVAPEVRSRGRQTEKSDAYSLGQLLIAIGGGLGGPGGRVGVPDGFYSETPVLARFVEDLTDKNPDLRLLIFQPRSDQPLYPQLRQYFDEELASVTATRQGRNVALFEKYFPLAGSPRRQYELWRIRRTQALYRDPRRGMHARWLLFWSWVSAAAWYIGAATVLTWWLRDLNWDWGNTYITLLQRTNHAGEEEFPLLDPIRADNYPVPDLVGNLPVRMVCMSFMLVCARYYQNLFAGLTPLVTGTRQGRLSAFALLAEFCMRLAAILACVLVLPATLIQRDWWPLCTAIGISCVCLCNAGCSGFALAAVCRARSQGLSTVPEGRISGLVAFGSWTPSAAFYSVTIWSIATLYYNGVVHDVYVYAAAVAGINTVMFYLIKCSGSSADDVRTALARACLAAERLRCLAERR